MKHYTLTKVGNEWCLARKSDGKAVAWSPAVKGSRTPSPEMKAYADEADKAVDQLQGSL